MNFLKSRVFRLIASLALAGLFYLLCPPCFSKMYLGGVLFLLVLILNIPKVFGNRWITHITRIAVGGLFIFSGFIKANDPVGFSYKLEEYFEVFGQGFSCDMKPAAPVAAVIPCEAEHQQALIDKKFQAVVDPADQNFYDSSWAAAKKGYEQALTIKPNDVHVKEQIKLCDMQLGIAPKEAAVPEKTFMQGVWEFFAEHSLFLAIFICGFEIAVGIFLLLGLQVRWTLFLLLAMIVFFSFLTFYSACCNKVTSCGCFGDAIKLTPWESFWKDLILLILISLLYVGKENIKSPFKSSIVVAGLAAAGLFASFAFPVYTWRHLPVIDFRPYAIGTNLYKASHEKDPKETGCVKDSTVIIWYYQKIGSNLIDTINPGEDFPDSTWQYYCRNEKKIRVSTCGATVLDFNLTDPQSGEEITDSILQMKGVQFMLVMYDLSKADRSVFGKVNKFYDACAKNHTPFHALSNAATENVDAFRTETGATFPFLTVDGTALKTVIRSNPGLVMLKDGVVVGMWHANDFPEYNEALKK